LSQLAIDYNTCSGKPTANVATLLYWLNSSLFANRKSRIFRTRQPIIEERKAERHFTKM